MVVGRSMARFSSKVLAASTTTKAVVTTFLLAIVASTIVVVDAGSANNDLHRRWRRQVVVPAGAFDALEIVRLLGPRNQVDLVFVLGRSEGVGERVFYSVERPLSSALLTQYATVHPNYVRTAAVTFAKDSTIVYDDISTTVTPSNKCELFYGSEPVWDRVVFTQNASLRHGTDLRDAMAQALNILTAGKARRPAASQVNIRDDM